MRAFLGIMPAVFAPTDPTLLCPLALVLAVFTMTLALWQVRRRWLRRSARRRSAAYQFMDCLKAYTAWIDWHRDEPLLQQPAQDAGLPASLAQAVQIKDAHFPELSPLTVQLLQEHRELVQYLWEESILRLTHAAPLRPHYADPRYHHLRDRQDATLDRLFLRCRALIGEGELAWHRTRSDFSFSGVDRMPSSPAP